MLIDGHSINPTEIIKSSSSNKSRAVHMRNMNPASHFLSASRNSRQVLGGAVKRFAVLRIDE